MTNDNDYPVRITDVAFGSAAATTDERRAGRASDGRRRGARCTRTRPASRSTSARTRRATFDVDGVHMGTGAANGCQGATFTIPVTLTGASNVAP